jgi:hypothetical protein
MSFQRLIATIIAVITHFDNLLCIIVDAITHPKPSSGAYCDRGGIAMHLALTATGLESKIQLYRIEVDDQGHWTYQSRAIENVEGRLTKGDLAQLKGCYDKVNWRLEVLNNPVNRDDRVLFRLEVDHGDGDLLVYHVSEEMHHVSWEFRDLVHFLRHNVATGADPLGAPPPDMAGRISTESHPQL